MALLFILHLCFFFADSPPRVGPNDALSGGGYHGALLVRPGRCGAGGVRRSAMPSSHPTGDVSAWGGRAGGGGDH